MKKLWVALSLIVATAAVVAVVVFAQDNAADTKRLIEALQLRPGSVVAEIGAGDGDLTVAVAKQVAPDGKRLRSAVEKSGVSNVQVIDGHESRSNLSEGCCNAIFMRNVYHHFGDPPSMNASFFQALKPGGRIAVIDFAPPNSTAKPGQRGEDGRHGVSAEVVAEELKSAGFELVFSEPGGMRWFIVVASKPVL